MSDKTFPPRDAFYPGKELVRLVDEVYDVLLQLTQEYGNRYDELYPQLSKQVASVQFGRGGEGLPRGFYCPSPVRDILVGGYHRGKILKRVVNWEDITAYGFNSDGELILLERSWHDRELILRMPDREIGLGYDTKHKLTSIEECIYCNGRLSRYVYDCCLQRLQGFSHRVEIEEYTYGENGLEFVVCASFIKEKCIPQLSRYQFFHDNNGFLSSYCDITNPANPIERPVLIKNRKA